MMIALIMNIVTGRAIAMRGMLIVVFPSTSYQLPATG
jgi:hypothetical protein